MGNLFSFTKKVNIKIESNPDTDNFYFDIEGTGGKFLDLIGLGSLLKQEYTQTKSINYDDKFGLVYSDKNDKKYPIDGSFSFKLSKDGETKFCKSLHEPESKYPIGQNNICESKFLLEKDDNGYDVNIYVNIYVTTNSSWFGPKYLLNISKK
jgi:hypothetical protein